MEEYVQITIPISRFQKMGDCPLSCAELAQEASQLVPWGRSDLWALQLLDSQGRRQRCSAVRTDGRENVAQWYFQPIPRTLEQYHRQAQEHLVRVYRHTNRLDRCTRRWWATMGCLLHKKNLIRDGPILSTLGTYYYARQIFPYLVGFQENLVSQKLIVEIRRQRPMLPLRGQPQGEH